MAVCLGALTGCSSLPPHNPGPFYPLGLFAVRSTNDFRMVKEAGFNLVHGLAQRAYLDAAQAAGLKVMAAPGTQAGPEFSPAAAAAAVSSFDQHPALWAWYLSDEPDLNAIPPACVLKAQRRLKALGARKPTALVLCQGQESLHYANLTDITMIDRYPVPWLPLANFGQHVQSARLALGTDKPLLAVIQAFDWTARAELLPGMKDLRPPTYEEIRCMTYEALARGANGLFYFCFDDGWKMGEHVRTWTALKIVIREVNQRLPLFLARPLWWAKDHDFEDPRTGFNAALQSSVTAALLRVSAGNNAVPPGDYILAVNNTDQKLGYSFALPPPHASGPSALAPGPVAVLDELRSLQPVQGRLRDAFAPYALHVYGPLP